LTSTAGTGDAAGEILDEILPDELDWRSLVLRYPRAALLAAAAGGFWLARVRGRALVASVAAFAADQATATVESFLGEEE
jgi:anti-sigma-K factor RskA